MFDKFLLDKHVSRLKKQTLIFLDDLVASGLQASREYCFRLAGQLRHGRVYVFMNLHSL